MPEAADGADAGSAPKQDRTAGLAGLIRALRGAGLDPDVPGLADALWLAQYARPASGPGTPRAAAPGTAGEPGRPAPPAGPGAPRPGTRERPAGEEQGRAPHPGDETVALHADPASSGASGDVLAGLPRHAPRVGVPEARALPDMLALERALRPLRRYRPPAPPPRATRGRLDERATAERTARAGGLLLPAFHAAARDHVELQLLMDAASAMRVWQRMLGELTEVLARLGAFRDIQVHYLHQSPDGGPAISRRFAREAAALHPERQLIDPTGRRLTLVVSDCAGPLWRSGAAHRLLHRLSRHGQVAVVQPLPQRLWSRTLLPVSHGTLLREEGPGGSARLRFVAAGPGGPAGQRRGPARDAVPVPLLPPSAAALGAWAGLLADPGARPVRAAVGWASPDQPAVPAGRRAAERSAAELLARFRATASPGAVRLAAWLAAAPLFLPVMQLVQRTMLPDSGPAELSEVMLGGLLRRREGADDHWYEFAEGVHEELLAGLGHDESLLVLKHCSGYVEQHFGKAGPNFPALALAQLTGDPHPPATPAAPATGPGDDPARRRALQPFAEVAAQVLRRFLPNLQVTAGSPARGGPDEARLPAAEALSQARELAARFDEDSRVRHLMAAVELLREAVSGARRAGQGADREVWRELAELLLRLWQVQHEADLLREARQAATTAAAPPGSVRARTVLARVLTAQARERAAVDDRRGALELWRLADRELAAVCATPGLSAHETVGPALKLVEALHEQWELSGDTGLLQESVGMLEAIADAWPGDDVPSGLWLARGRALLRLAGVARDTEEAEVNAEQAADSLQRGCQALRAESAPPRTLAGALLEQVDALLLTGRSWQRARPLIAEARTLTSDPELQGACLVRFARLHVRHFAAGAAPDELDAAAQRFAGASALLPRDRPEYCQVLQEWGDALLTRASLPGGGPFISQAVRVMRNCRMETSDGDPQLPQRLLMLGRALTERYRQLGELVDLREAEYLFSLAAGGAHDPLTRARALFEEGEAHHQTHRHTLRPERLDLAAESYRKAVAAALDAERDGPEPSEAMRLAADALHQRGLVYEAAHRPLAASDAYRESLRHRRRLPAGGDAGETGEAAARTEARLYALQRNPRAS